jgi:hypothetical protein
MPIALAPAICALPERLDAEVEEVAPAEELQHGECGNRLFDQRAGPERDRQHLDVPPAAFPSTLTTATCLPLASARPTTKSTLGPGITMTTKRGRDKRNQSTRRHHATNLGQAT